MNRGKHDEYSIPPEESAPADEFRIPDELTVRSEFFAPAPENLVSDEYSLSYETVKNDGENAAPSCIGACGSLRCFCFL